MTGCKRPGSKCSKQGQLDAATDEESFEESSESTSCNRPKRKCTKQVTLDATTDKSLEESVDESSDETYQPGIVFSQYKFN